MHLEKSSESSSGLAGGLATSGAMMRTQTTRDGDAVDFTAGKTYAEESDDTGGEGGSDDGMAIVVLLCGREAEGATVTAIAMAPEGRRRRLSRQSARPQTSRDGDPDGVLGGVGGNGNCPVW